jgi:fatty acid synthase
VLADLTGGLGDIELDMAELAAKAREEMSSAAKHSDDDDDAEAGTIAALPAPPRGHRPAPAPACRSCACPRRSPSP